MGNQPNIAIAPADLGLQKVSLETLAAKYLYDGEQSVQDNHRRVARAIAAVEPTAEGRAHWEAEFLRALAAGAVGGGRIMAGAGRDLGVTLINCFVEPIGDSMTGRDERDQPGIMTALAEAAETMRLGGGVGYNFSAIRPRGAQVKGTDSRASGPLTYMDCFDSMCRTVESAGSRRGAQMAVLDVEHPDIEEFITAKATKGRWTNFNVSVGVSAAFMTALAGDADWQLVHEKRPHPDAFSSAFQRDDGLWVYRTVKARDLWHLILRTTYEYAEPGVIFLDRVNSENNLAYVETIRASNPCGEQMLPAYGCCDLASVNLCRFVRHPFSPNATFDFAGYAAVVRTVVRFLDNVLDATRWPLEAQRTEAHSKRRIGQGYFGLGSAMMMLGIRYGSPESVAFTEQLGATLMESAYDASVDLAIERGPFPLFDAKQYVASGFARRLPLQLRQRIAKHGIRNSHLLSIAPTGTMALSFGDNASNGIEPAFSLSYQRRIRQPDDTFRTDDVEDHAFRVYKALGGDPQRLPPAFVTARDLTPEDHLVVMAAAQRFVDSSISKTINCPESISFEDFGNVYLRAYELGCKSCTTYRPSKTRGAVLIDASVTKPKAAIDPDRRLTLKPAADVAMGSLRWPKRPDTPDGAPSWTIPVDCPSGRFALTIAHYENGSCHPFEVWAQGQETPRGLTAIAKLLSMDMRSTDRQWLQRKLAALVDPMSDDKGLPIAYTGEFELRMPPDGQRVRVSGAPHAMAKLIEYRARALGYFDAVEEGPSPMLAALTSVREPKTDGNGSQCWYVDVRNHATGDDFVLFVKEAVLADQSRFPFSVWLSGRYPKQWDGLCKLLSYDMRVSDPKWISAKLASIADYQEAGGEFWAHLPGTDKQANWPSTIAYVANLLLARYRQLGILDAAGEPVRQTGLFALESAAPASTAVLRGDGYKDCSACGGHRTVHRRDGCDICSACSATSSCG